MLTLLAPGLGTGLPSVANPLWGAVQDVSISFRCVLNWFGDWSTEALYQVGKEFTSKMDLEKPNYIVPDYMPVVYDKLPQPPTHREAIVNSCVFVHQTLHQVCALLSAACRSRTKWV